MINLDQLFANSPTVELIEPRHYTGVYVPRLRLLLTDITTGAMHEVTIEADAFLEPRVAPMLAIMLAISVMDVDEPEFELGHGEYVDDGQSVVVDEVELPAEWCVTPGGEQVDLRLVGRGLF